MKSENIKKIVISILILLSIFFLDRISKILILNILEETGRVDIYINSFLNFYLVWNKGIGSVSYTHLTLPTNREV